MTAYQYCPDRTQHGRHEWYHRFIFRRDCPGLIVSQCPAITKHDGHWVGEMNDEWCPGRDTTDWDKVPFAGRCKHGEQMLNECEACEAEQEADVLVTEIEEPGR